MKTIMLQAASQRGILTAERLEEALKPGADLHQACALLCRHRLFATSPSSG